MLDSLGLPELAELVVRHARVAITITDAAGRIVYVNPAFTRVTGYAPEQVLGHTPRMLGSGLHDADFYAEMWGALRALGRWEGEVLNRRRDGTLYVEWISIVAVHDVHGAATHYFSIFHDISERKRAEARTAHMAMFDELTDLPNRHLFDEHLRKAIQQARRRGTRLAVLFLDLDGFKAINDSYGHVVGDEVLRLVAARLQGSVRESDLLARRSGDEFTVCLVDPTHTVDIFRCAAKLRTAARQPVPTPAGEMAIDMSIGVAIYPDDAQDGAELLQLADERMYARKRRQGARRRRLA